MKRMTRDFLGLLALLTVTSGCGGELSFSKRSKQSNSEESFGLAHDTCAATQPTGGNTQRLTEGIKNLAELGSRMPGSAAHEAFTDQITDFANQIPGAIVKRESQQFKYWEQSGHSLEVKSIGGSYKKIPIASYYLHAAAGKVSGSLKHAGSTTSPNYSGLNGKIAVVDMPIFELPLSTMTSSADLVIDPTNSFRFESFRRAWQGLLIPTLEKFAEAGAIAVVFVQDTIHQDAKGQIFFGKGFQKIPALIVSKEQRGDVIGWFKEARLTLQATVADSSSDHVIVELPGVSNKELLITSHTDGPNVIEENGTLGMLELLEHYSKRPPNCRPLSLRFLFATGHMESGLESAGGYLKHHAEIKERTVATVVMEHLGALHYEVQGNKYVRTGRVEPGLTYHSANHPDFADIVINSLRKSNLNRMLLLSQMFGQPTFIGEGIEIDEQGVPTFGYVPVPTYLLAEADNGHIDKVSIPRMQDEIRMISRLIDDIMSAKQEVKLAMRGTYTNSNGKELEILVKRSGRSPDDEEKPLFVWVNGTNYSHNDHFSHRLLDKMVERGFDVLSLSYPNTFLDGFSCQDLDRKAHDLFSSAESSGLNMGKAILGRKGTHTRTVVAGFSQGAWIAALSKKYEPNTIGSLQLATGDQPFYGAIPCVQEGKNSGLRIRAINGSKDGVYGGTSGKNAANLTRVTGLRATKTNGEFLPNGDGWMLYENGVHEFMYNSETRDMNPTWRDSNEPTGLNAALSWMQGLVTPLKN